MQSVDDRPEIAELMSALESLKKGVAAIEMAVFSLRRGASALESSTSQSVDKVLLSQAEVADTLGVHVSSVKRLVAKNELPTRRIGRLVRIHVDDVKTFVQGL